MNEDDCEPRSRDDMVADYLERYADIAKDEMRWFRQPESITEAIDRACDCRLPNGRGKLVRHGHQRRIPTSALRQSAACLSKWKAAVSDVLYFRELHDLVEATIGPIAGIGELAIYDIAHRIGAHRGLAPAEVYVHCGVRKRARAPGFAVARLLPCASCLPRSSG